MRLSSPVLRSTWFILCGAVAAAAVDPAPGQEGPGTSTRPASAGSSTAAPDPRTGPLFRFEELSLDLGFDAEWRRRQTNSEARSPVPFRYRQTDSAYRFEETLGLHGAGDVGGPRLLRYQFDVRGGLSQERYREHRPGQDLSAEPHGEILEYDARMTLLPAGRITANLFALQRDDRVPRPFLPSLDRRRERYGAELLYNDRALPMRLAFESEYEELRSFAPELHDDERRGEKRLEYEATWQPTEYHRLQLRYEYDDRSERYSGTATRFDTTRNYVTLDHALQFGSEQRSRLDTIARFQDETGDLARDVAEFAPQLRLQHTDALASVYRAQYLDESFEGVGLRLFRGDAGLQYRHADWLDLGLNLYGLTQEADRAGDVREWGGVATAALQRENEHGRFTAHVTYNHAAVRSAAAAESGVVIAESATFRDPLPVFLARPHVRRGTIVVTDAARRRTYFVGQDFAVAPAEQNTSLTRIRTGRIVDGQTVLISYLYEIAADVDFDRDRVDLRIQQAFSSGWTPYYAAALQNDEIDAARTPGYPERDLNRHRLGLDYRRRRWSVGAEAEYNDDSIDPYVAGHLRGDATLYEKPQHALSGRGTCSFFHFRGADELGPHDVSLADVGLSYRYLMGERWEANATTAYRFEDDTRFGVTHGVDLAAALHWRLGYFTATFEVEYDLLDLPGSDDGTFVAWIKLRREIPLVRGSGR